MGSMEQGKVKEAVPVCDAQCFSSELPQLSQPCEAHSISNCTCCTPQRAGTYPRRLLRRALLDPTGLLDCLNRRLAQLLHGVAWAVQREVLPLPPVLVSQVCMRFVDTLEE